MSGPQDSSPDPLAALRDGDPELFERFVEREAATFHGFYRRLGAAPAEAEDLTQELFLRLVRHARRYQPRERLEAFCFRIARNAWVDHQRRRALRPVREADLGDAESPPPSANLAAPQAVGDPLELREESERLLEALAQLPEAHRLVFELGAIQERPYAEIAAELDIPVGTVKSRMHHALRKLRGLLEPAQPTNSTPPNAQT